MIFPPDIWEQIGKHLPLDYKPIFSIHFLQFSRKSMQKRSAATYSLEKWLFNKGHAILVQYDVTYGWPWPLDCIYTVRSSRSLQSSPKLFTCYYRCWSFSQEGGEGKIWSLDVLKGRRGQGHPSHLDSIYSIHRWFSRSLQSILKLFTCYNRCWNSFLTEVEGKIWLLDVSKGKEKQIKR